VSSPSAEGADLAARHTRQLGGETPIRGEATAQRFGSDLMAEALRALGLEYIALNPGSSFRGLHDSLVNHLGNSLPQLVLCLHEEHAVAIAHGYAKVTDRPMAVALHSNVGLMHASMALFNAFCDRIPVLAVGATGPLDAVRRRPWIDWLHTATDQAALVRPFLKWDDQPHSVAAAVQAILQAHRIACTAPKAPTYICLDASLQEQELDIGATGGPPTMRRFEPSRPPEPDARSIDELTARLAAADRVVMLVGRTTRDGEAWQRRVELAERLGASVHTHLKLPAGFPSTHRLHPEPPQPIASPRLKDELRSAEVILALEWLDLGGTIELAGPVEGHVVAVGLDEQLHRGWSKESFTPVPADVHVQAGADATVLALLHRLRGRTEAIRASEPAPPEIAARPDGKASGTPTVPDIASCLRAQLAGRPACLVRAPLSWSGDLWPIEHPLDYLGADGGEGVGSGPGMTIGAALALREDERLVVSVLGDGDFLMSVNALWTAAHYQLPMLIVIANNRSFFNDEIHQHQTALRRGRPTENRWIGQRIINPDVDLAQLAAAQGLVAFGPVLRRDELAGVLSRAIDSAAAGAPVVVDVHIASAIAGRDRVVGHTTRS
jgi:thiamine pyrophosphate-dependent acetolactate synthase large subunit-like protein